MKDRLGIKKKGGYVCTGVTSLLKYLFIGKIKMKIKIEATHHIWRRLKVYT